MSASFPGSVRSLAVPAAGDEILFSDVADMSEEVTAMLTAFVNGRARCSAYSNATQSVSNSTNTALTLNTEEFDVGAMHDNVTNNSRITIPSGNTGIYLIIGGTNWAANATGFRNLFILKNAATILQSVLVSVNSGSFVTIMQIAIVASLTAGDFVELYANQNSGGALNAGAAGARENSSYLQVIRIW